MIVFVQNMMEEDSLFVEFDVQNIRPMATVQAVEKARIMTGFALIVK